MSSSTSLKRYAGSVLLYQAIDDCGHLLFLQRNIRHVLAGYERELETLRAEQDGQSLPTYPEMRKRKRTAFEAPDKEILQAAIQADIRQSVPARLRILPKALERKDLDYAPDQDIPTPDPEWLPPSGRMPVSFTLEVVARPPNELQRVLLQKSQPGALTTRNDLLGQTRFEFDFAEPFFIDADQLYASKKTRKPKAGAKKNINSATDLLRVSVKFDWLEDAKDFESKLSGKRDLPPLESLELCMTWNKLPECPPKGVMLSGHCLRNGNKHRLAEWGLAVDMGWSNASQTALTIVNQALYEEDRLSRTGSSSKANASPSGMVEDQRHYHITYVYLGDSLQTRGIEKADLKCIFCDSKAPHPSFDSLHFHYTTNHDHFSFTVSDGEQTAADTIEKIIEIYMAEPQRERASNHVPDIREIHWVRPDQPFDLEQYLNEDDRSWVNDRLTTMRRGRRQDQAMEGVTPPDDEQMHGTDAPEDVPDLPVKVRKTFVVPKVPGVTFFRTHSKRPIEAGESLEESDDDIDDSWLQLRQSARRRQLIPEAYQEFIGLYDAHMSLEAPRGIRYLRNALVRFTRAHVQELRQTHMLAAYSEKLMHLEAHHKINKRRWNECLAIIQDGQDVPAVDHDGDVDMTNGVDETAGTSNNTSEAETQGQRTKTVGTNKDSDALLPTRNGSCVCGRPCTTARGAIFCANVHCSRNEFHLGCVGLEKRIPGWYCANCQPSVDASPAPVAVM